MKTKQVKAAVAALLLVSLLSGCYPTGNEDPRSDIVNGEITVSNSGNTTPGQIVGDTSIENTPQQNINYNLTLPTNTPGTVSQIRLQVRKWKDNEIESIFLDGKTVVDKKTYEPDFFPDDLRYVYLTSDNWWVIREPGVFTVDNRSALVGEFHYGAVYPSFTKVCLASDEELSAFSRGDAIKRVNEILDKLNIPYGTPYVIPVKADIANENLRAYGEFLKALGEDDDFSYTPWGEENEIYILIYPLIYEGMELTMYDMKIPSANDYGRGASVEAVVSKDDLISIRGRTIYQAEYEAEEQIAVKYGAEFSLNKIKEFYAPQIISEGAEFYHCKLVYVPIKKESEAYLSVVPAWEFDGAEQSDYSSTKTPVFQFVYAHNGNRYSGY